MVNVGIIGLGSVWDSRYQPALARLRGRISVCALYDPVSERATQVAAELRIPAVSGMAALGERLACDAFLILDPGWAGIETVRHMSRFRKPIYLAGSLGNDLDRMRALRAELREEGLTLMPEFSRRYTPATGRLQELMATKLGHPQRIEIEAVSPRADDPALVPGQGPGLDFFVGIIDWCRYVTRTRPLRVRVGESEAGTGDSGDRCIRIEFARPRAGGEACIAELRLREDGRSEASAATFTQRVVCERGDAHLSSDTEIVWRNQDDEGRESLTAERSDVEVMLDHFCRRVVGGLTPIADVEDVCRGADVARAFDECLRTGLEIVLEPTATG